MADEASESGSDEVAGSEVSTEFGGKEMDEGLGGVGNEDEIDGRESDSVKEDGEEEEESEEVRKDSVSDTEDESKEDVEDIESISTGLATATASIRPITKCNNNIQNTKIKEWYVVILELIN
jgi:hypothetical protein